MRRFLVIQWPRLGGHAVDLGIDREDFKTRYRDLHGLHGRPSPSADDERGMNPAFDLRSASRC